MLQKLVLNFVNFIGKTPKIEAFCPKMQNYRKIILIGFSQNIIKSL